MGCTNHRLGANINIIISSSCPFGLPAPPTPRPAKTLRASHTRRVRMHLGVYWERGLRPGLDTHTFLVMVLGVASSCRRGDARAVREAGEM